MLLKLSVVALEILGIRLKMPNRWRPDSALALVRKSSAAKVSVLIYRLIVPLEILITIGELRRIKVLAR